DFDRRGDPWWTTRLGLDFATLGRWIDGEWLGGRSFKLESGTQYNVTMVIRAIQPTSRHLHVGMSVSDVGNIPAAPTVDPIPPNGPVIYAVFTEATGAVIEPLDGINVGDVAEFPDGNFILLETWPWATVGVIAQILIGLVVIAVMFWYGKRLAKQGGG
ncbi:MAG: methane monooxygenase/ammonia monooxygenase subunit B, partial [Thermoplasmata archaeon]